MYLREILSGGSDPCRDKALAHVETIKGKFNEATTDEEKFQTYMEKFKRVAHGVSRCRENFSRSNYKRWLENKETAAMLHMSNREGIILMSLLAEEMKQLLSSGDKQPLARVNGTSLEFAECAKILRQAKRSFSLTDNTLHEKIICDRPPSAKPILVQKLQAVIAMIMAHFVFVPDGLLT